MSKIITNRIRLNGIGRMKGDLMTMLGVETNAVERKKRNAFEEHTKFDAVELNSVVFGEC